MKYLIGLLAFAGLLESAYAACDASVRLSDDSARFIVKSAGVVRDSHTGLLWQRCPQGQIWSGSVGTCEGDALQFTWFEAMQIAASDGWRVPNKKELVSIIAYDCNSPAWHAPAFGQQPIGVFWSSTPLPYFSSGAAWAVDFADGAFTQTSATNAHAVRLVKSAD